MISQKSEWLAWPPPLFRTAVRLSSGMLVEAREHVLDRASRVHSRALECLVGVVHVGRRGACRGGSPSSSRRSCGSSASKRVRKCGNAERHLRCSSPVATAGEGYAPRRSAPSRKESTRMANFVEIRPRELKQSCSSWTASRARRSTRTTGSTRATSRSETRSSGGSGRSISRLRTRSTPTSGRSRST